MSMLRDLYERVLGEAEKRRGVQVLEDLEDTQRLIVYHGDGTHEETTVLKEVGHVNNTFHSLESFTRFISTYARNLWGTSFASAGAGQMPQVYVSENFATCLLRPESNRGDSVFLPFHHMPELAALLELTKPARQTRWMTLLRSVLGECFDPALTIQMRELEVGRRGVRSVKVGDIGTSSSKSDLSVDITTGEGTNSVPLKTDWLYSGPVFRCHPELTISVRVRLEAVDDGASVAFRFLPLNLETEMDDAIRRMVELLEAGLNPEPGEKSEEKSASPRLVIPVYHGMPGTVTVDEE